MINFNEKSAFYIPDLAPIVLFVYNRISHVKKTIEELVKNDLAGDSDLIIYSDGPENASEKKKVQEVRDYVKNIRGFKNVEVIERDENWGLANSVIDGVTKVLDRSGRVIVIEDDIVTTKSFLKYMNEALVFYKDIDYVWSVTGFSYPLKLRFDYKYSTYLYPRGSSKSWATWKDKWDRVIFNEVEILNEWSKDKLKSSLDKYGGDLFKMFERQCDKKIDSWAIRYVTNQIMNKAFTVHPVCSYVYDIGDDHGTHASNSLPHNVRMFIGLFCVFNRNVDLRFHGPFQRYLFFYFVRSKVFSMLMRIKRFL